MYDNENIKSNDGTCRNRMMKRAFKIVEELTINRLTPNELSARIPESSTRTIRRDLQCLVDLMVVFRCEQTGKFYRNRAW